MNICIVSTFDGTTEDFMEIFNWARIKHQHSQQILKLALSEKVRSLQWEMLLTWKNFKK